MVVKKAEMYGGWKRQTPVDAPSSLNTTSQTKKSRYVCGMCKMTISV